MLSAMFQLFTALGAMSLDLIVLLSMSRDWMVPLAMSAEVINRAASATSGLLTTSAASTAAADPKTSFLRMCSPPGDGFRERPGTERSGDRGTAQSVPLHPFHEQMSSAT